MQRSSSFFVLTMSFRLHRWWRNISGSDRGQSFLLVRSVEKWYPFVLLINAHGTVRPIGPTSIHFVFFTFSAHQKLSMSHPIVKVCLVMMVLMSKTCVKFSESTGLSELRLNHNLTGWHAPPKSVRDGCEYDSVS